MGRRSSGGFGNRPPRAFATARAHLELVGLDGGETWGGASFDPPLVAACHLADRCLGYLAP